MKFLSPIAVLLGLSLISCETGGDFGGAGYDPLDPAGVKTRVDSSSVNINSYRPGEFVSAAMDNTAFFKKRPSGGDSASKLLPQNTQMRVVKDDGSYLKVELDSGESGYVPAVQVVGQGGYTDDIGGDAVQVWPPVGGEPLPSDIAIPDVDDAPLIPTTIDPDTPMINDLAAPSLPDDVPSPSLTGLPELPDDVPMPDLKAEDPASEAKEKEVDKAKSTATEKVETALDKAKKAAEEAKEKE